jgi:prepilin-type N-terminal cleavage/methylation domain-containing protein
MVIKFKTSSGFSLVEMMVSLSIIAIMGTMAIDSFQKVRTSAKQSEARVNLQAIYTLETVYYAENNRYADFYLPGYGSYCESGACSFAYGYNPVAGAVSACLPYHMNLIGFAISGCGTNNGPRYGYFAHTVGNNQSFVAIADSYQSGFPQLVFPGCTYSDAWGIDQTSRIVATDLFSINSTSYTFSTGTIADTLCD